MDELYISTGFRFSIINLYLKHVILPHLISLLLEVSGAAPWNATPRRSCSGDHWWSTAGPRGDCWGLWWMMILETRGKHGYTLQKGVVPCYFKYLISTRLNVFNKGCIPTSSIIDENPLWKAIAGVLERVFDRSGLPTVRKLSGQVVLSKLGYYGIAIPPDYGSASHVPLLPYIRDYLHICYVSLSIHVSKFLHLSLRTH